MLSATVPSLLPDRAGLRPWVGSAAAVGSGVLVDVRILVLSTSVYEGTGQEVHLSPSGVFKELLNL